MSPDDSASLVAIASLPGVGPARLRKLLEVWDAADAWEAIRAGRATTHPVIADALGSRTMTLGAQWRTAARELDVADLAARHRAAGVRILTPDDPDFPTAFRADPEPPAFVSAIGDLACLDRPMVAVVGTRSCTRYGHDVARRLGCELAAAGVAVVSGLALGIDAAVHEGVLESTAEAGAAPIAVVGTGLDVVYPRRNRALWERVGEAGLLLSEAPLGAPADAWRFPARNRLIAALARAVVVVESGARGGSLHTVDEAALRAVDVAAMPGPVTSPVSAGTNQLLADGAAVVRDARDVLDLLGLDHPSRPAASSAGCAEVDARSPDERRVMDALTTGPATLAELSDVVALPFARLASAIATLEGAGHLSRSGGWYEPRVRP
jgi:DNA processing protein